MHDFADARVHVAAPQEGSAVAGVTAVCSQARVQSLRGAPQVIVDLIQDIEYDPASREASNIQRGDEPSLAREQVANVELGQMVCDSA